ncbi:unnamed protein product [Rangifer tarandus platyrhynchus]|uniref:Uncharacterized protein n=1 Tax=Rangifer tarandus platyrhynchus TaxID=3082113 RepID=A0AC59YZ34_RANTA
MAKIRCEQSCVPLRALGQNLFFAFSSSKRWWPSLACGHVTLTSPFIFTSPSLTLTLLPASYKDTCDSIGPIWIILENLPISKSLLTSAKSFLSCKITNSQLPAKIGGHLWGAIILLTTLREKLSSGFECSGP